MEPRKEVHSARRDYRCAAPYRLCERRILKGQAYTLISYPPGSAPFNSPIWTNLHVCSACEPLPAEHRDTEPCPIGNAEQQCSLIAGHQLGPNPTPHEYPIGLF